MTLGLSIGNSLGIGNNVLPDLTEVTRLWTPGDTATQFWYDDTSWPTTPPSIMAPDLFNKSGEHSHLSGTYYGDIGYAGNSINGIKALYINQQAEAIGQVQVADISQSWLIAYDAQHIDNEFDKVFDYGNGALVLETGYNPDAHKFKLPNGQYTPALAGPAVFEDPAIACIRIDKENGQVQIRINGCKTEDPLLPGEGWISNPNGISVVNGVLEIGGNVGMQFCEMISLSTADELTVQTAEGYLGHKWGIPLCAGNPFVSGPPTVTTVGPSKYLTDEDGNYITDDNGAQVLVQGM